MLRHNRGGGERRWRRGRDGSGKRFICETRNSPNAPNAAPEKATGAQPSPTLFLFLFFSWDSGERVLIPRVSYVTPSPSARLEDIGRDEKQNNGAFLFCFLLLLLLYVMVGTCQRGCEDGGGSGDGGRGKD